MRRIIFVGGNLANGAIYIIKNTILNDIKFKVLWF